MTGSERDLSELNDQLARLLEVARRYVESWGTDEEVAKSRVQSILERAVDATLDPAQQRFADRLEKLDAMLSTLQRRVSIMTQETTGKLGEIDNTFTLVRGELEYLRKALLRQETS